MNSSTNMLKSRLSSYGSLTGLLALAIAVVVPTAVSTHAQGLGAQAGAGGGRALTQDQPRRGGNPRSPESVNNVRLTNPLRLGEYSADTAGIPPQVPRGTLGTPDPSWGTGTGSYVDQWGTGRSTLAIPDLRIASRASDAGLLGQSTLTNPPPGARPGGLDRGLPEWERPLLSGSGPVGDPDHGLYHNPPLGPAGQWQYPLGADTGAIESPLRSMPGSGGVGPAGSPLEQGGVGPVLPGSDATP
jgi:hypothetical protein